MTTFPNYYSSKAEALGKLLDQMDKDGKTALPSIEASYHCRAKIAEAVAELYSTACGYTIGHKQSDVYAQLAADFLKRAQDYIEADKRLHGFVG